MSEPVIDLLETEWAAIDEFASTLSDDDWATPTALPGWSVKDNVSHIIGVERMLAGDAAPDVDVSHLAHVHDPFAASMEAWIEARRPLPATEVLADFRDTTARRLEQLRAMSDDDFALSGWSPIGEVPYRQFMRVRVFDSWMHEQDMRRALNRPGNLEGPVVDAALENFERSLGFVVGKKAGAPDGSSVTFLVDGPTSRVYPVLVEGRARLLPPAEAPTDATVTITLPLETFAALGGGRWDRETAIAAGGITIGGDAALARAVLDHMAFTP